MYSSTKALWDVQFSSRLFLQALKHVQLSILSYQDVRCNITSYSDFESLIFFKIRRFFVCESHSAHFTSLLKFLFTFIPCIVTVITEMLTGHSVVYRNKGRTDHTVQNVNGT